MATKRVLLVGGSRHGTWVDIPMSHYTVRLPKPTVLGYGSETDLLPDFIENYWVEKVPVEINELRCVILAGIWTGFHGVDKTKALVHALFQRDIVEKFDERGWDEWASTFPTM